MPDAPSPPNRRGAAPPQVATEPGDSERPTLSPPFDVEAFARATTVLGPAAADQDLEAELQADRITLTNEVELELARARSAQSTEPPRRRSSGALSVADALAPSTPPPHTVSSSSIEAAVLGAIGGVTTPEITERAQFDPLAEMRERFSLGDYSGALEMAERVLSGDASSLEAAECGESSRAILEAMFAAKLGALDRVAAVIVPRTQMRWLSIDHRAGFVLSLVDGVSTVEMILDVSGMPRLDALRILYELVQQRIVALR